MNIHDAPAEMRAQAFQYMAKRSVPGPALLLSFFIIISYVTPIHNDRWESSLAIFISLLIIALIRTTNELGYERLYRRYQTIWEWIYVSTIACTALIWGLWCLDVVSYYGINWVTLTVLVCTAGVSAGGIIAVIPHFRLSFVFQSMILLPVALYSLTLDTGHAYTITYLFICYLLFMTSMSWKLHSEYWQAVENARLLNVRAQELMESRDTAIKLANTKSDFLATMSHEIRTPMNGILGMAQILHDSKLDEEQRDSVDIIISSTRSLLSIINDILDFSKLESGNVVIEHKPIFLKNLTTDIEQLFRKNFRDKYISFDIEIDSDVPSIILSDANRLKQILINLTGNALKFTEQGKVKLIILNKETVSDKYIRFEIHDTGIGISEEAQNTLFDSFTQADASTTRKYGGTGLGLAICKKIVEAMHGEIGVNSHVNKGSVFWFEIPGDKSEPHNLPTEKRDERAKDSLSDLNILLVEDNPINIKYAEKLLLKRNVKVDKAENGQKALNIINDKKYDVILMDLQMPEMDGFEAAQKIRESQGINKKTPIIAVTANTENDERIKCAKLGMNDFVAKPYTRQELLDAISRWTVKKSESKPVKINMERVNELKEIMEEEFENLVATFLTNTSEELNKLQTCKDSNDLNEAISILSHLKSATQNMGATILTGYLATFEEKLSNGSISAQEIDMEVLLREFSAVQTALNS